ncbi:MAG TPA: peptide ABC transporter substrate-binding protein, partial [Caulobacteraceae bacterium]|nr:peptide ABC transporter substrate-binding protein [Caulobacteraceae bacterium]
DPHKASGTWEDRIISDAIVGLTQDSPDGGTIPGMAERWETSPDGLTWTFHLRNAVWSDGAPVTAEDFVFSFRRILSPKLASQYAYLLYFIKNAEAVNNGTAPPEALGARAIDPRTLELRLEHPAPYLPEIAKHTSMFPVPKHAVEKWGDRWSQAQHYVGNGPYNIVEWRLGDYVKAVKNPRFYDAKSVCFDTVFYYPTVDAITAERRVARGEIDANSDIQSNRIAFLREKMPGYVRTHTYVGVAYLAFNAHVPAFRDKRVRLALDMAIDRDFITGKLLRGGQLPAYTFVPPGVANYPTPATPPIWANWPFERRIAAAKVLMQRAGYGPDHRLRIEIKHRNSSDPMLFMPAIQQDWSSIYTDAALVQNDVQIAYQSYRIRDFQVADAAWIADFNDAMTFLGLQQSATGQQNYGDYNSPAYDALLAAADHEADVGVRAEDMRQAESIMLKDAPLAPIFFYVNKNLVNPRISGWVDNIIDHHRTRYLCEKNTAVPPKAG